MTAADTPDVVEAADEAPAPAPAPAVPQPAFIEPIPAVLADDRPTVYRVAENTQVMHNGQLHESGSTFTAAPDDELDRCVVAGLLLTEAAPAAAAPVKRAAKPRPGS